MGSCNGEETPVNSFALVCYLPEPLGSFLDRLRAELVHECHAKAHVTVLPPRPLKYAPEDAWQTLRDQLQDFQPFPIELGEVEIFPVTQVVYLSVKTGHAELRALHARLCGGKCAFAEPFEYHPHVTLAQDLEPSEVQAVCEKAQLRWREFPHPHSFVVDRLTFVQNTLGNRWTDLHGIDLASRVTI